MSKTAASSWLLTTPKFHNRLLEADPSLFLRLLGKPHVTIQHMSVVMAQQMFPTAGVPSGALFVSSKTTSSKEPFIAWASKYLAERGAPILPLDGGACRTLFKEASEDDLRECCATQLLADIKSSDNVSCHLLRHRRTVLAALPPLLHCCTAALPPPPPPPPPPPRRRRRRCRLHCGSCGQAGGWAGMWWD